MATVETSESCGGALETSNDIVGRHGSSAVSAMDQLHVHEPHTERVDTPTLASVGDLQREEHHTPQVSNLPVIATEHHTSAVPPPTVSADGAASQPAASLPHDTAVPAPASPHPHPHVPRNARKSRQRGRRTRSGPHPAAGNLVAHITAPPHPPPPPGASAHPAAGPSTLAAAPGAHTGAGASTGPGPGPGPVRTPRVRGPRKRGRARSRSSDLDLDSPFAVQAEAFLYILPLLNI